MSRSFLSLAIALTTLYLNYTIDLLAHLKSIYNKVPFPKGLERTCILDSGPPSSLFPSLLVANLVEEAVEEVGRDFLKAHGRILSNKGTILVIIVLDLVETLLCLRAITYLPESFYIKIG